MAADVMRKLQCCTASVGWGKGRVGGGGGRLWGACLREGSGDGDGSVMVLQSHNSDSAFRVHGL